MVVGYGGVVSHSGNTAHLETWPRKRQKEPPIIIQIGRGECNAVEVGPF